MYFRNGRPKLIIIMAEKNVHKIYGIRVFFVSQWVKE